jgi:hypothetical protein
MGNPTQATPWRASPDAIAWWENDKPGRVFREELVPAYTLPDALRCADGTCVTTASEWEAKRRPETLELFREHVFGHEPEEADPRGVRFEVIEQGTALEGRATRRRVRITIRTPRGWDFAFETWLFVPNARHGPAPAFLLINNRKVEQADPSRVNKTGFWPVEDIIARGFATAVFRSGEVQPDTKDSMSRGLIAAWDGDAPRKRNAWAAIAAWSWAASRVLDYLRMAPEVDPRKIAIVGHSRGGKTALWTGARDPRFAMVVANESGRGGAALTRRRYGETVAGMNADFPHWFCGNHHAWGGREDSMPVDQHQLIGLCAPRPVCVGSADRDLWADPNGQFLAMAEAGAVYGLYGHEPLRAEEAPPLDGAVWRGRMHYHVRSGEHTLAAEDWTRYMDFAERLFRQKGGAQGVAP